ncbi:MAG: glycosyltransferase family 2 protein [Sphingobacterium sp.]|jgi:glycosyltransferase involved in cell wall biosynthesis|nr:glycosyltransferase family 2 protein [Sphingobacterium sp.]
MFKDLKKPLVTIVIPCYNSERTIVDAVTSALSQDYAKIEVIVVDDGSTDNSGQLIKNIMNDDPRLSYCYQENKGVSAARNRGLNLAKGRYISFLDGDDKLKSSYISLGLEVFESNPTLTLVYSNMELFEREKGLYPLPKFNVGHFLRSNCIPIFALVRTEQLRTIKGFDESISLCEDWECWVHLLKVFNTNVYRIEEPQYYYRRRFTNDSNMDQNMGNDEKLKEILLYIFSKHQKIYFDNDMGLSKLFQIQDEFRRFKIKYYNRWYKRVFYKLFKPSKHREIYMNSER